MDFLVKFTDIITLTDLSKNYLLPESSGYWGSALVRAHDHPEYSRILMALKKSDNAMLKIDGENISQKWKANEITYDQAKQFTAIMHATIFSAALCCVNAGIFDCTNKLLDIGAGSGCFSLMFLKKYMNRQAGIFELPEVCQVAKKYFEVDEILLRVNIFPGNFFNDDFPTNFDGILLSNILHDWSFEIAKLLLKKAYCALEKGGKIFLHEMLLNEQKSGPMIPSAFNLLMYINHKSQQFTYQEIESMLVEVGFLECRLEQLHPFFSVIIANK